MRSVWLYLNLLRTESLLVLLLRLSAFLCFAGWAWQHLYWQVSYGELLWNEGAFSLAERFGIGWETFTGSGANDGVVQNAVFRIGWLYLIGAILCLTVRQKSRFQMLCLLGGSCLLVLLSYAKFLGAQRQLPMFVEHGGQMLAPALLVIALRFGARHRFTVVSALIAFVTTFAGHGAYAVGMWPTPANFFAMTSLILGVDYDAALLFLRVAGILDFAICIGIFIPYLRIPSVLYGVVWGALTALARPVAGMSTDLRFWGVDQFLHEAILRAPHVLIPLFLFFLFQNVRRDSDQLFDDKKVLPR